MYWLTKNRKELVKRYIAAEEKAAHRRGHSRITLGLIAPYFMPLSMIGLYAAMAASRGYKPSGMAYIVQDLFGVPGVVVFWVSLGVYLFAFGLEMTIGNYWRKTD